MERLVIDQGVREVYRTTPISYHRNHPTNEPMKWPRVLRACYAKLWSGAITRAILKGPRGGGKSKLLGTLGHDLWFFKKRKVVNMAGSQAQADIVYNYFVDYTEVEESIKDKYIEGEVTQTETLGKEGHAFSSITASTKSVRGKHPDVLLIDEVVETDDGLVHAALPMVNTSPNPLVVMASTFHKIFGIFQETWDNAEQLGYTRFSWDIFDVTLSFDNSIWDKYSDVLGIEKLRALAKGRTGDPEGWVRIENIIQAWREKPTEDWFLVEYMGSRPSASGLVLKPEDVDVAVFDDTKENPYGVRSTGTGIETVISVMKGLVRVLGIDWGFSSMTSVTDWGQIMNEDLVLVDNKNYTQVPAEDIIKDVVEAVRVGGHRFIYADSAGKFENVALQNALNEARLPCRVIEVVFAKEKDGMLGNFRARFEQRKVHIPHRLRAAYWQYKRYRYAPGSDKPVKKDDHIPDSTMCAWQHWILNKPKPILRPLGKINMHSVTGEMIEEHY